MAIRIDALAVSAPGLRAFRWSTDQLYTGLKEMYAIGRVESGRSTFWGSGREWTSTPGSFQLKRPGDVHRDVARDGPSVILVVALPPSLVEGVTGQVQAPPQLDPGDERGAVFERLLAAVRTGADRFALEVAVAEAVSSLAALGEPRRELMRPVRRAVEMLHERLAEPVTLDALAAHAGVDKFRLCRAFRAQIGLPPHAYLTQLRVQRARHLLARGVRPGEVAPAVGLYDQSQLHRHFRRIVGTTPARYARGL